MRFVSFAADTVVPLPRGHRLQLRRVADSILGRDGAGPSTEPGFSDCLCRGGDRGDARGRVLCGICPALRSDHAPYGRDARSRTPKTIRNPRPSSSDHSNRVGR